MQQLVVLENTEAQYKEQQKHLNRSQQLMDLPLWQLLCIHQSGKTLIIPQQSMSSKKQSLCFFPMPLSAFTLVLQALLSNNTPSISAAAEGNANLMLNTAQQPANEVKETTPGLYLIFLFPPGPLHFQPLTPTLRRNKQISCPRFAPDSV